MKMLPIGPLMIEHRFIERMIQIMKVQLEKIQTESKADSGQIERIIHFIKGYADRCHHGKEEEILFRELGRKNLSPEHKRIMQELIEDHKLGRKITMSLLEANQKYQQGEVGALSVIADGFRSLIEFYPKHIQKEDRHFFIPVMGYFSREEKEAMIQKGYESDSRLFHQEHEELITELNISRPSSR
jgi:hemerythrin-like domain-containing protein